MVILFQTFRNGYPRSFYCSYSNYSEIDWRSIKLPLASFSVAVYRKLSAVLQFIAKKVFPDVEKEAESEEKSEEKTQTEAANLDILKKLRKSKCHLLLSEDNLYIVYKKSLG